MTAEDPEVFIEPTDEVELSDEEIETLVGNVDDDAPVVLETMPDREALHPPQHWEADAHADEIRDDPEIVVSEDPEDGED